MPELPEVTALAAFLYERSAGHAVESAEMFTPRALKTSDVSPDMLVGRRLTAAGQRGKYVILDFDGLNLVFHLAKNGWVTWHAQVPEDPGRHGRGPLAMRVRLDDGSGFDLTEEGAFRRLAVHLVPDPLQVAEIASLGPDALDPALDEHAFAALFEGRRARLKNLLTDQKLIAGIGNAYSDEILHRAQLSPFRIASKMTPFQLKRMYESMRSELSEAVDRLNGDGPETLKDDKRVGLRVHGRAGEPCSSCGGSVHEVPHGDSPYHYCPVCQPDDQPPPDAGSPEPGRRS